MLRPVMASSDGKGVYMSDNSGVLNGQRLAYNKEEARHQLGGLSLSTLNRYIRNGKIRAVKFGRRTIITHEDIVKCLRNG